MKRVRKYRKHTRKNVRKRREKPRYRKRRRKTRYRKWRRKTRYRKWRRKTRRSSAGGQRWEPKGGEGLSDLKELKEYLIEYGIEAETINKWSTNKCNKTLKDLLKEIKDGDCVLEIKKDPTSKKMVATRIVHVARAVIFYNESKIYQLKEVKQIKTDEFGKISCRLRTGPLGDGVILSEKMKPTEIDGGDEGIIAAIRRGLQEELGKKYADNFKGPEGKYMLWQSDIKKSPAEHQDSNSYTGLPAIYYYYTVKGMIPDLTANYPSKDKIFYITDQADGKKIGWQWKKITK